VTVINIVALRTGGSASDSPIAKAPLTNPVNNTRIDGIIRTEGLLQLLFIHQNLPGQFRHLAAHLARDGKNRVVFLTKRQDRSIPGVDRAVYTPPRAPHPRTHHYLHQYEDAVLHGQAAARACIALSQSGFTPDLVVAHPGWGESLFIKDIWPEVLVLNYGEFFYRAFGTDVNFDPERPLDIDTTCKLRARNAHLLVALEAADRTLCPTEWQKSVHPSAFHDRISVVFDGVDTAVVAPDPRARVTLPNGRMLTAEDEVVSYVARNLEPLRGFRTLMRSLPLLCARRPHAQIVIVGNDGPGYGWTAPDGVSWRERMLGEVAIDRDRVHFLGIVPYAEYLSLLQISAAHVYLTAPFVLSWSVVEAMAAGCLVIGSRTAPVEELIEHGRNGLLVNFFSPTELADTVSMALGERRGFAQLCSRARETVLEDYSVATCLPRQLSIIADMTGRRTQQPESCLPVTRRPVTRA
jgi:glycosyltransferase involved in cell wall biosynthesis